MSKLFVHLKSWTLLSLQWVGRVFPHTWEMWEASSRKRSMRTSDTTLNREKVGRFSIQLKSVLQFRIGKRYEDSPSNCIVCTTFVFTTVLRHICIEYCWRNPYFAFMSAPPCLFAFPFTPHFDVHLLLDLFHVTKTCFLTNQPKTLADGDDSGVEDSQNSSISKKSWVTSQTYLWNVLFHILLIRII